MSCTGPKVSGETTYSKSLEADKHEHTSHIIIWMKKFKKPKNKWSANTQAKLFTMKYYRFSRRRKDYFRCFMSKEKSDYIIRTERSKVLDSGFFDNQVWGALHKAWKGYIIAKNKDEYEKMQVYARRVQELQHDLGLEVDSFDNIEMSAAFYGKLHRKITIFKNKKHHMMKKII